MDSGRGENDDETDQGSRRKAKEILGNRHEEVQIKDSVHIGYFIQYVEKQKDWRKTVEIRFKAAHERTKCSAFSCMAGQQ